MRIEFKALINKVIDLHILTWIQLHSGYTFNNFKFVWTKFEKTWNELIILNNSIVTLEFFNHFQLEIKSNTLWSSVISHQSSFLFLLFYNLFSVDSKCVNHQKHGIRAEQLKSIKQKINCYHKSIISASIFNK